MEKYTWDGYWWTQYSFEQLNENDTIEIQFEDEFPNNEYTPTIEQQNAISYIINNQEELLTAILMFLIMNKRYREIYGDYLPKSIEELTADFHPERIVVTTSHKDKVAYIELHSECEWDPEHGVALLIHKNRILDSGGADEGFSSEEVKKDGGKVLIFDFDDIDYSRMFVPDPVYGTKPSHNVHNDKLLNKLISENKTEQFIQLVEDGQILLDYYYPFNDEERSLLERVCKHNHVELIRYIVSKNVEIENACLKEAILHLNKYVIGLLLDHGADINGAFDYIYKPFQSLVRHLGNLHENHKELQVQKAKELLLFLLQEGADSFDHEEEDKLYYLSYSIKDDQFREEIRQLILQSVTK